MKEHVSILGVLYICFGALGLMGAVFVFAVFGGVAGVLGLVAPGEPDAAVVATILGIVGGLIFTMMILFSLPGIVVGVGLLKFRPWGRIGGLVLSALNILNFPLGTALGVYGLWVLLHPESEPLFV